MCVAEFQLEGVELVQLVSIDVQLVVDFHGVAVERRVAVGKKVIAAVGNAVCHLFLHLGKCFFDTVYLVHVQTYGKILDEHSH